MKIIAIGDIHGRDSWKKIIEKETFDKVVIIGDYFDAFDNINANLQKDNFKDLLAFKMANMDKVILEFGNHDYHYLKSATEQYPGFQKFQKADISELLHKAIDENLLQMCFIWDNLMFTHAGVTQTWCDENDIKKESIERDINDLFKYRPNAFRFTSGPEHDKQGNEACQSPIWVRPGSLMVDKVPGFIHIVGHTAKDNILFYDEVILIDTLGTSGEYLIYEDGKFTTEKIK